ncbi:DEAD/DEAH box helicase family protein [Pseudomonas sp. Kh13]|uniref:DEAD/DEAH box helicase family protein n=1 Tax=Pseudomonas sp. Kh13 TaxID=2093744 RepID=UPI0015B4AAB8|nr:DEAD/DEAH box helicase [Pseudomonas sp. Kh13]
MRRLIYKAEGRPGSGKTETVLQALPMLTGKGSRVVIALPTIALIAEVEQRIDDLGLACKRIDSSTDTNANKVRVVDKLNTALIHEKHSILLCTQQSMQNVNPESLSGWTLIIDELPKVVSYIDYSFDENETNRLFVHLEEVDKKLSIKDGHEADLKQIMKSDCDGVRGGTSSTWSNAVLDIFRLLLLRLDVFIEALDKSGNRLVRAVEEISSWWSIFSVADEVHVLAANVVGEFEVFAQIHGFEFEQSVFTPPAGAYECPITIYPMVRQASRFSQTKMIARTEQGRNIDLVLRTALANTGSTPLLSANKWGELHSTPNVHYLPKDNRGLNQYSNATEAIALFGGNPSRADKLNLQYLAGKYGLSNDTIENAFITTRLLEPSLQFVTRTAIRNPGNTKPIRLFVQDERVANYLVSSYLENAKVDWSLSECLPRKEDKREVDQESKALVLSLFAQGMSARQISRETELHRATVTKIKFQAQQQAA